MTEDQRDLLLLTAARYARTGEGKRIRAQANVQQQDMARRVGITANGLYRWEQGQRRPHGDAAVRWVQQLSRLELMNAQNAVAA